MTIRVPERVSLELTQRCAKGCHFCYNGSGPTLDTAWAATDVIQLVTSLAKHGTRAVSLGGGEPLEYAELEDVFDALRDVVFLSMTTNGLLLDEQWSRISRLNPAKVHVSIHYPAREREVDRVIRQVQTLRRMGIRSGVNLLIRRDQVAASARTARLLRENGISNDAIVYLPMRGQNTPTPAEILEVAGGPFQSMTCLKTCGKSPRFTSIDAHKTAAHCSYTTQRRPLETLDAAGLARALDGLGITFCGGTEPGDLHV